MQSPSSKVYSAPRRFDLATIMVVTLAYSVLLGGLRLAGAPPIVIGHVVGFITCVGIGQALFFGGKWPRTSSALIGIAYMTVVYLFIAITDSPTLVPTTFRFDIWFSLVFQSAIAGYVAGIAVGFVFLVSEVIRKLRRADSLNQKAS